MKIRMKVDVSGARDGRPWPRRGEVADVSDGEGAALCASGMAEPVAEDKVETATPPADGEEKRTPDKPAAKAAPKGGGRGGRTRGSNG